MRHQAKAQSVWPSHQAKLVWHLIATKLWYVCKWHQRTWWHHLSWTPGVKAHSQLSSSCMRHQLPLALLLQRACWKTTWQQRLRCEQRLSPLGCHGVWHLLIQEPVLQNGVKTKPTCQILTHWPSCASDPSGWRYQRVVPSISVWTITSNKKKLLQFCCNLLAGQSETYRRRQCAQKSIEQAKLESFTLLHSSHLYRPPGRCLPWAQEQKW